MKTVLNLLLNFFPTSFQKTMGPAWQEAIECQLEESKNNGHKMQILAGIVFLHLFVSLPQSYCYSLLNFMKTTTGQPILLDGHGHVMARIRQRAPVRLHGLGRFLLLLSGASITGFSFSAFVAWPDIQSSSPWFEGLMISLKSIIAFSLIILFSFIVLFFDKLRNRWWILLLGFVVGFSTETATQLFEFEKKQEENSALITYSALSSEIFDPIKNTHPQWYEQDSLKKEHQGEFCQAATSKISLWQALRKPSQYASDYSEGLVLSLLYKDLYYSYHCYSKKEYLALLDAIANTNQKSLQAYRDSMPWVFRFLTLSTLSATNSVLTFETSPYDYCTSTFNSEILKGHLFSANINQDVELCSNQPKSKPVLPRHWWEWAIMTPSFKTYVAEMYKRSPRIDPESARTIDAAIQRWVQENPTLLTDKTTR